MPGALVLILLMLMEERLGLAVMTSEVRLVESRGARGQESTQPSHRIRPSASWRQGQGGSLGRTISLISTRQVRAATSSSGMADTVSRLTGQVFFINISVSYQLGRNVSTNQISCYQDGFLVPGKNIKIFRQKPFLFELV